MLQLLKKIFINGIMLMNGKKRVLSAFERVKADRVPVDFSTNEIICQKLMRHFNVDCYEKLLQALNVDFRRIDAQYTGKPLFKQIEGMSADPVYGHYTKWIENEFGGYWDYCYFPLKGVSSEEIFNYPVPNPDDFDYSPVFEETCAKKEYALYCGDAGIADIINSTGRLLGMEDTLINLIDQDEATLNYINRRVNMQLGVLERILNKAKGSIDFLWMGEDLGTQIAPMISLELYRKVLKPIHLRFVELAESYNIPVMIHSCGSSSWCYDDFIEMGISAVDTLQPEAANMSPKYLAERFGGRLSFHGCISTAGNLAYGTKEQVEKEVKEILGIMKPTRGYMLAPTHQIQDNTPVENIAAMYKTAIEYGKY